MRRSPEGGGCRWARALAIFAALCAIGCSPEGSYRLRLLFPEGAEEVVREVTVWAAALTGFHCDDVMKKDWNTRDLEILARLNVRVPEDVGRMLEGVPAGIVAFIAEGRTAGGARVIRGCEVAEINSGAKVYATIRMEWVCPPEPGEEIPCNGEDDNCDGRIDNCASDGDCDCGACTSGTCVLGECHQSHFPDGSQCEDGLYCTEEDTCQDGACTAGVLRACSDGLSCTQDVCNEEEGKCEHAPVPSPGLEGPAGWPSCRNGKDDDCDGWSDGEDADCENVYTVVKALPAPSIDGDCADFTGAQSLTLRMASGEHMDFWMMWDEQGLYICASVVDDSLDAHAAARDDQLWEDDSVEIWFDVDHDGGPGLRPGDYKFWVNVEGVQSDSNGGDRAWNTSPFFESAAVSDGTVNQDGDTDTGYTVEMAVTWASWGIAPPSAGAIWGLDLMLNDQDDVDGMQHNEVIWANLDGGHVNSADGFGDVVFAE